MADAYDPQNVFARILRHELACEQVYEDSLTVAFMDLMPQAVGHVLVIPREPAETLLELSAEGAAACMRTTQRLAAAVKRAFDAPGIMIMQVNGAAAGQTVPHVHFHVIPRRRGEPLLLHAAARANAAELRANAERIRESLANQR